MIHNCQKLEYTQISFNEIHTVENIAVLTVERENMFVGIMSILRRSITEASGMLVKDILQYGCCYTYIFTW